MNILYIYSSNIDPMKGGVQRVTSVLSQYFKAHGHQCYYLSSQFSDEGITNQYVLPIGSSRQAKISYIRSLIKNFKIDFVINQDGLNKEMTSFVHESCYGLVRIITMGHNSLLAPADKLTIVRYSFFKKYHLTWLFPIINSRLVKKIILGLYKKKYQQHYANILKYSEKFVLLSHTYVKELSFFVLDIPEDKVIVIPNPYPIDMDKNEGPKKTKTLLYVGRVSFPQKRNDLLVRIWSRLWKDFPDWKLKIVGDGEDLNKLKALVSELNVGKVELLGYKVPKAYYSEASIFCMTSAYEGFPLVLAEAMNYGDIPIVFNSYGAAADIITNKENGILVEPFVEDAYAQQLRKLMSDEQYRISMSEKANKSVSRFNLDNIGKAWLNILKS